MALCGCSADNRSVATGDPGQVVTSLHEIRGPWDIASFDGYEPMRLHGGVRRAFVDVRRDGLSYSIECNYSGNPARIDDVGTLHNESKEGQFTTLMSCESAMARREDKFYGFFTSKPKVTWTKDGGLRLFNGQTELLLERPEVRRLANVPPLREVQGRWVPQMATRIERGGHSGWGFQGTSVLTIAGDSIRYDGCGGASFTFSYTKSGRMADVAEHGRADCGSNTPAAALLRVLRGNPLVERSTGSSIALTSGDYVISLQSEAELLRAEHYPPPPLPPSEGMPPPFRPSRL